MKEIWVELFGETDKASRAFSDFKSRYGEIGRFYHTHKHIESCLACFRSVESSVLDPFSLQIALLFHDVMYDPTRSDNEFRSAEYAVE
ncbi:MAG: hypothetical protein NE330_21135, partial [Lentisphaeraceae bacterium]|nr:hypothetical protein [Lentisphaeraceae bacterium]